MKTEEFTSQSENYKVCEEIRQILKARLDKINQWLHNGSKMEAGEIWSRSQ
ncbi:MAG: hypothetical protein QY332_17220 [Anaerolineales bacterium]|nr:MAG: hypothetical protein QY332_17220 [Anaerolineales bacterium]